MTPLRWPWFSVAVMWIYLSLFRKWFLRGLLALGVFFTLWMALYWLINPPTTPYMMAEGRRQGEVIHEWVNLDQMAPIVPLTIVAAEDANFCRHWGIDPSAIRAALSEGGVRGGSTISQQMVKNLFLWQGRNWLRKVLEAGLTPVSEIIYSKRRMLEMYLNMIEFDTGVFGIQAAARHHFGIDALDLNRVQAARLAAVLPNPKAYSAVDPSSRLRARARSILAGADTIRRDGRADCFLD